MANSRRDQNSVATISAVSSTDNEVVIPLEANPTTDRLRVDSVVTGGLGQLITEDYDYIAVAYPTSTTETYTYKDGGSGGTTVATITLTYTDSNKTDLSSVAKT